MLGQKATIYTHKTAAGYLALDSISIVDFYHTADFRYGLGWDAYRIEPGRYKVELLQLRR